MVTFDQLASAQPAMWVAASQDWDALAKTALAAAQDIQGEVRRRLTEQWTSDEASPLAKDRLTQQARDLESAFDILQGLGSVVDGAATAVQVSRRTVQSALDWAAQRGLVVNHDIGAVSAPDGCSDDPGLAAAITETNDLLLQALVAATQADQEAAAVIARIAQAVTLTDPATAENTVQNTASMDEVDLVLASVPQSKDQAEIRRWWDALTPAQQQQLELAAPGVIGELKGIPSGIQQALRGADGKFDRAKAVVWATQHWNDVTDDIYPDNCANFVSDTLHAAGVRDRNNGMGTVDDSNWNEGYQTGWNWLDSHDRSRSRSWTSAQHLHDFLTSRGGVEVPPGQAEPGDVVFFEEAGPGHKIAQGSIHHAAIITSVTPDGQIHYTQHSDSMLNGDLQGRTPDEAVKEGPQNIRIVQVRPDW